MNWIRIKIIDRYLIKEFLKPFLFFIFALTVIMVSVYLFELSNLFIVKKVPLEVVLKLLIYKLPGVIVQSFSVSILFSTLFTMSQFVKNNEFTAFRMGGVALHRLVIPLLIIGILVSGLTYFINEQIVPWSNHQAENIVRRAILEKGLPNLQQNTFFEIDNRHFYIENIDNKTGTFHNIIVYEFEDKASFARLITANEGYFKDKIWYLKEGVIHQFNQQGELIVQSDAKELRLNVNQEMDNFYGEQRTTSEMSRAALKKDIKIFRDSGLDVNGLLVDYHLKLAQVFSGIIFILVGVPLSVKSTKGRAFGLIASIVIIFAYYLAQSFCRSLGRNDLLIPVMAAWLPNLIFAGIGIFLVFKEEYFKLRR